VAPTTCYYRPVTTLATGVDMVEIERVARVLARHPRRFIARVFTEGEARHCRGRISELAVRFAAKEAVMKALGTGVRGIGWREIEVLPNRRGKPLVRLHGNAAHRAAQLGLITLDVSLSHSRDHAIALAVALIDGLPEGEREPRPWLVDLSLPAPARHTKDVSR
jgi:holo-[acyl-carrier protein] synthase